MFNPTPDQPASESIVVTNMPLNGLLDDGPLLPEVTEAPLAGTDEADAAAGRGHHGALGRGPTTADDNPSESGPHPTIAKRIVFDGNVFDIPRGTPVVILNDNNALRRAYATALARPELTQAQMEEATTVIDGHAVPTVTLRVRPQVKGASAPDAPPITDLLECIPTIRINTMDTDDRLLRRVLRGGHITTGQAVRHNLGDRFDTAAHPRTSTNYGGLSLCALLDTVPSDAAAAPTDVASFDTRPSPSGQ